MSLLPARAGLSSSAQATQVDKSINAAPAVEARQIDLECHICTMGCLLRTYARGAVPPRGPAMRPGLAG